MGCNCGKAKIARPATTQTMTALSAPRMQVQTSSMQVVRSQAAPMGTAPVTPKMVRPQV